MGILVSLVGWERKVLGGEHKSNLVWSLFSFDGQSL